MAGLRIRTSACTCTDFFSLREWHSLSCLWLSGKKRLCIQSATLNTSTTCLCHMFLNSTQFKSLFEQNNQHFWKIDRRYAVHPNPCSTNSVIYAWIKPVESYISGHCFLTPQTIMSIELHLMFCQLPTLRGIRKNSPWDSLLFLPWPWKKNFLSLSSRTVRISSDQLVCFNLITLQVTLINALISLFAFANRMCKPRIVAWLISSEYVFVYWPQF